MVDCNASNKGLFVGMIFYACTLISVILYAAFRNRMGDTRHLTPYGRPLTIFTNTSAQSHQQHSISSIKSAEIAVVHDPSTSLLEIPARIDYSIAILEIINLCLLAFSLFATIWSFIKIRKLDYRRMATRKK